MWSKSYSLTTKKITKEQIWKLYSNVDQWHTWDSGTELAKLEGEFKTGTFFAFKPRGGPNLRLELLEVIQFKKFTDLTRFPLARMTGEHLYEETVDGLKMTVTMTVSGPLSFIWRKLVAENIVKGLPNDMLVQIKAASKL
jgi:hypothetical protein